MDKRYRANFVTKINVCTFFFLFVFFSKKTIYVNDFKIWYLFRFKSNDPICIIWATKGQSISKANCQAMSASKKRTNEFIFTTMRRVFVCFLEEIDDTKKFFWNYLTFTFSFFALISFDFTSAYFLIHPRYQAPSHTNPN